MHISARVLNSEGHHQATVTTNGVDREIVLPSHESGSGTGINGGELLFLALATCYCNDLYREAARLGIDVREINVEALGEFGGPGEPPVNVRYHVRVVADAPEREIRSLMIHTDTVSEIQNTLRAGIPVRLGHTEAISAI